MVASGDNGSADGTPKTRRSFDLSGSLGLISTSVAVLVGLTSVYATTQAMRMTQASAQQMLFENQLDACLSLNDLSAAVNKTDSEIETALEAMQSAPSAAATESLRVALVAHDVGYSALNKEYRKIEMLIPEQGPGELIWQAMEVHFDLNAVVWAVQERGTVSAAERADILAREDKEEALLGQASDLCGSHIADVVRGKDDLL